MASSGHGTESGASLPPLPRRIILASNDSVTDVLSQLDDLYTQHLQAWSEQVQDRYQRRETRYEEEFPRPEYPVVLKNIPSRHTRALRTLPDGRRAIVLDSRRLRTLCGVQTILSPEEADQLRGPADGHLCVRCGGRHVTRRDPPGSSSSTPTAPAVTAASQPCRKCQADLTSSGLIDETDLKCLICGHRTPRPIPQLSDEEVAANADAVERRPVTDANPDRRPTGRDSDPEADMDDSVLLEICNADEDESNAEIADVEEHGTSPYDDPVTITDGILPLTAEELQALRPFLGDPSLTDDDRSPVITYYLALARQRAEDSTNPASLREALRRVIADDLFVLADLLHDPAYRLFQNTRLAIRQVLVDRALRGTDDAPTRMAMWAAAGRLMNVTHSAIPASIEPENATSIADWLLSLTPEDLSLFAGDPDATQPLLQHPSPDLFETTDQWLRPLIRFLANELQRFRNKAAGCRLLAQDYHLSPEALQEVAKQSGQWPAQAGIAAESRKEVSPESAL